MYDLEFLATSIKKIIIIIIVIFLASFAPAKCWAAFAKFQLGYTPSTQIFYNIVTDGGATCNGDKQTVALTISTPPPSSPSITVFSDQFTSGDVNKAIAISGIGNGGGNYVGTITAVGAFNGTSQVVTVSPNTGTQVTSVLKDVTYGSDDAPAFKTFNTWAQTNQGSNQVVLTVPNGSVCWIGTNQVISQPVSWFNNYVNYFFSGINNLIVEATGATIDTVNGAGVNWGALGQMEQGLTATNGRSARIESASAGATTVTLTSASYSAGYISRFSVGAPVMISGMDIQTGYNQNYGVPSNHQFVNYAIITAVCNNTAGCPGTATVTFDKPLAWEVLSTWPEYFAGGNGQLDQGGPATIYALHPFWNATVEYRGLTIADSSQSYAKIRTATFKNVTINSPNGLVPTNNETFTIQNSALNINSSPGWEIDKLITTLNIDGLTGNGTNNVVRRIDFQSSSVDNLTMSNSNIGSMFGSPKSSTITDTHFDLLRPGAWTNGASTGALVCTRCDVTDFQQNGGVFQNTPSFYSMSSGVVTVANADNVVANGPPHRIFVPSGNVYMTTLGYTSVGLLQTTTQTQDATNVYTQTSEAGGFPGISGYSPQWLVHPAPVFTCDACTGDPEIVGVNIQSGATPGAPLGQFATRTFTPTVQTNNLGDMPIKGKIVSLTIDVTTASTHTAGAIGIRPTGQAHLTTIKQSDWSVYDWVPSINAKQLGRRVITPSGVTCDGVAGACAGDGCILPASGCFALPEAVWIQNVIQPAIFGTFTGGVDPTFTITIETDQGVVP